MNFLSTKETAEKWGISVQLVRKYLKNGRIAGAIQKDKNWMIPEDAPKPGIPPREQPQMTALLKKILYQQVRNNHFGIYEYLQLNLTYSSCRMSSNRLKRKQIEDIYRTDRIDPGFEPVKIDDILEAVNHMETADYVIQSAMEPLTTDYVKKLHYMLTHGTFYDRREHRICGSFRTKPPKYYRETAAAPNRIAAKISQLIVNYEKKPADLQRVLAFHVNFEKIRPFEDYNGRVGRLIMVKECLRYGIDPFIIDDKHRGDYNRGIAQWEENPELLTDTALWAQRYFQNQMDTCRLFEYCRPQNPRRL